MWLGIIMRGIMALVIRIGLLRGTRDAPGCHITWLHSFHPLHTITRDSIKRCFLVAVMFHKWTSIIYLGIKNIFWGFSRPCYLRLQKKVYWTIFKHSRLNFYGWTILEKMCYLFIWSLKYFIKNTYFLYLPIVIK